MNLKSNIKIHNRFDVFKKNIETGKEEQVAYAENIILDQLWTYFAGTWGTHILIGTGTGVLSAARTTLFTPLAAIAATMEATDYSLYADGIVSKRRYIVLSEVQYVDSILTEIGVGVAARPYTHAMLMDMNGNPVSIEKTSLEILTLYATIYVNLESASTVENLFHVARNTNVNGKTDESPLLEHMLGSANLLTSFGTMYMLMKSCNNGGSMVVPTPAQSAYSSTTVWSAELKKATFPTIRIPVGLNTINPIRSIGHFATNGQSFGNLGDYCMSFWFKLLGNPAFAGSFVEGEPLGVGDGLNQDFCTDYGFVKSGAIVYVDGAEQVSGVTVDTLLPIENLLEYFCEVIESSNAGLFLGLDGRSIPKSRNDYIIFENQFYADIGIDSINFGYGVLSASNDLVSWTEVSSRKSTEGATDVSAYRDYRYWKYVHPSDASSDTVVLKTFTSTDLSAPMNVHFDVAPAEEAVVTIDYTTQECIKTTDYVIDIGVELTFGEYVEEY